MSSIHCRCGEVNFIRWKCAGEEIVVYAWVDDAWYLYTLGEDDTLSLGDIDRETFSTAAPVTLTLGFSPYSLIDAQLTPNGTAIVFESGECLYRYDFP